MLIYINQSGEDKIKNFVYKGGSDSLTYQYIWSPFAEYLLKFTPSHIAPNLITMISLILLTIAHIIFVTGMEQDTKIASWRILLMGIAILVYQNLDNLDGKQARKTKSSSPLGMLFDHGADSLSSFLITTAMLELLEIKSGTLKTFVMFTFVMLICFAAMWSQYCVGFFRLGRINPIDQGLPCYALTAILSIFVPYNFWNLQNSLGRNNQVLLFCLLVLVIVVIYFMVKQNYSKTKREKSDITFAIALPVIFLAVLGILYLQQKTLFQECYFPIIYSVMFAWGQNMIQIQLCAVTEQKYNPFSFSTLSFVVLFLGRLFIKTEANTYFTIVALISFTLFFQFATSLSTQIAKILNIKVFTIKSNSDKTK